MVQMGIIGIRYVKKILENLKGLKNGVNKKKAIG